MKLDCLSHFRVYQNIPAVILHTCHMHSLLVRTLICTRKADKQVQPMLRHHSSDDRTHLAIPLPSRQQLYIPLHAPPVMSEPSVSTDDHHGMKPAVNG